VTCDHCGARYKLDEARISGRGAKITCPRCSHVFVVYREQAADIEPQALAVGGDRVASSTGGGVHPDEGDAVENAPPGLELEPAAIDVHALEFRKVGIQSWKVKVKIGLVYDFSDFKTLAKYIAEGRVTEADLLSHDGETWLSIGDIDDLEQHFVDVYVACEAALAAASEAEQAEGAEDYEDDSPTNIVGMEGLADSLGSDLEPAPPSDATTKAPGGDAGGMSAAMDDALRTGGADQSAAPRFVDPFEARKRGRAAGSSRTGASSAGTARAQPAASTPAASGEAPKSRAGLAAVAVVLLALGAGGYWWTQQPAATAPAPAAAAAVDAPGPGTPEGKPPKAAKPDGDADARSIEAAILDGAGTVPASEQGGDDGRDTPDWDVEERAPCPRGPDGRFYCPDGTVLDGAGDGTAGGSVAASGPVQPGSPAPDRGPGAAADGVEVAPMSARDHASEGDRALARSDYRTAVAAFRQAQ
ncbi:MAG: zinc-ribbon domain-containing protein, partial [Myxococcota bacterium]|nr:zinc-ribbon domain-containing protein [Myxococcota bacterium]